MTMTRGMVAALLAAAGLLAGCAGDGLLGGPTTAALPEKPKVDPACVSLASQIDALRKDGVADRVAAAAQGKTATVNMKRDSLAKVAELNKANADFQMRCGTVAPASANTAQPSAPAVTPAATAKAVKAVSSAPAAVKSAAVATPKTAVKAAAPAVEPSAPAAAVEAVKPKTE